MDHAPLERRRAKEDPGDADEEERDRHGAHEPHATPRDEPAGPEAHDHSLGAKIKGMQAAPEHEAPIRAVPEASEQHGEAKIRVSARDAAAISAQRDIEIVAQPGGERDVPALPEVGESRRCVRVAKVIRQGEAEAHGDADRARRIAGEVAKDLAREGERAAPGIEGREALHRVVGEVHDRREDGIREDDLLEEPEEEQKQSP